MVAHMKINYTDGRTVEVANEDEAREILDAQYPEAEYADWQQSGYAPERMLVWEDSDAADNDDGANAVAEIVKPSDQ